MNLTAATSALFTFAKSQGAALPDVASLDRSDGRREVGGDPVPRKVPRYIGTAGRGLLIHEEQQPGELRHGRPLLWAYGEIPDTVGGDGEPFDVILGPQGGDHVTIIDQLDPETGEVDEHKTMWGWVSEDAAVEAYLQQYGHDRRMLGGVMTVPLEAFAQWAAEDGKADAEPFADIWFAWQMSRHARKGSALERACGALLDWLGKGAEVDALIAKVMRESNVSREAAIRILKANGTIKQDGAHLTMAAHVEGG